MVDSDQDKQISNTDLKQRLNMANKGLDKFDKLANTVEEQEELQSLEDQLNNTNL